MKIKCIAFDDEPLALEKMAKFVQKVPYLELLGTFDNALQALQFLKQTKVDLLFLDIQMDELTDITDYIQEYAGDEAEIIFGHGVDSTLGEIIRVTVIATGFGKVDEQGEFINLVAKF